MKDYRYLLDKKESINWLEILGILASIPLGYIFIVILFCL
jgi:hypothetical protein